MTGNSLLKLKSIQDRQRSNECKSIFGSRSGNCKDSAVLPLKELPIELEGTVKVVLPGTMFRVELDNQHLVLATISGKMRKRFVRLTVGDRVKMEMSPYDVDKARITWRLK